MTKLLALAFALFAGTASAQWGGLFVSKPSGDSSLTIGTTAITGGATTQVLYNLGGVIESTSKLIINATAGQGPSVVAGTATTDVAALSVTRTNNNAAVATGVKFTFTDGTSAPTFKPFQILCGAAGTTDCFSVDKNGTATSTNILTGSSAFSISSSTGKIVGYNNGVYGWGSAGSVAVANAADTGVSRVSAGIVGIGTGAANAVDGTLAATNYRIASTPVILGTAPTIASGGCTSPTVTDTNGSAYFTIDVGTSCSGSQPVTFTLPAATTGWNCYARNVTDGAGSAPAQTGAISTSSVTITNFARTTGVAAAWTDGDDVVVSCLGG